MQEIVQQWLNLVCQMLPGVNRAVVVVPEAKAGEFSTLARFPERAFDATELLDAAALAARRGVPATSVRSQKPGVDNEATALRHDMLVAFPLQAAQLKSAVISVQLDASVEHQAVVSQILEWSKSWLRLLLEPPVVSAMAVATTKNPESAAGTFAPSAAPFELNLFEEAFSGSDSKASAAAAARLIKEGFACQRVCIGLGAPDAVKIAAVSDVIQFDDRVNELRDIEQAMRLRCAAPVDGSLVESVELPLAEAAMADESLVVPLRVQQRCWGALVLQREAAFTTTELAHIDALAKVLAAQFALQSSAQRLSLAAIKQRWHNYLQQLLGPGFFKTKLVSGAMAFALLFLVVIPGEYRVAAPASLEGKIQRAVVAPFDGYIATAQRKAGETVSAGDVIAELDQRQITLERARWVSERAELGKQYRKALAELDHAEAQILKAQIAQAEARLELVNQQMQRAQLIAPIDGIIIAGDLSRSLGAPVERGEVLFEVAPLNEYRIVLQVSEKEIREIEVGQQGWLSLTALAGQRIPFVIEQVATVFEQIDGEVLYRTEARVAQPVEFLRPGMQGTGKISVASRSYGFILFHDMFAWLGLKLWSLSP